MTTIFAVVLILVVLALIVWACDLLPFPEVPKRLIQVLAIVVAAAYIFTQYIS